MTLYRAMLRDIAIAALKKKPTLAGPRVYSPQDTPTWNGEYPMIFVRTPQERKESLSRGPPQFNVVATLQVTARLEAVTAEKAEADLEVVAEQIERTLINDYDLTRKIQQFSFIDTRMDFSSEGQAHLGQLTVNIGLEFFQGPEDFAPIEEVPLRQINLTADMAAPFDAQGIYKNPPYPAAVTSPPRSSGPDGRPETGLVINLPEDKNVR